jgi:NAD(P)-dependent dehydrogenase (short-subunit alcohol dehydrogenase family)
MSKTWFITGVSSGFGYHLTKQLLENGNTVIGTIRNENKKEKVKEFLENYPETYDCQYLDVTNVAEIHKTVENAFKKHEKIDVVVSNAGYGLFGAAEELNDDEINHILATNLTGSIMLIKDFIPYMRKQKEGRIIQISSYGGQVAFPGNSLYHASKFGIEGFCESVAQEVAPFNIGLTIVEPGGARTEFRYNSARIATLMKEYDDNPAHDFLNMLDKSKGLAAGNPSEMAKRIIESVEQKPAPLRIVFGSQALNDTINRLNEKIEDYKKQYDLAKSTDYE